ncbi:MAG: ABC transporter ATP-binding protein [Bacteroidales bacterium]|nr:ABC transporter ATP-binding protein [Bacteroidales bacterium]
MPDILNIKNLSCGYGNGFHLHKINLNLPIGSFTGIIGPNGSGKTTLFKAISGILKPKEGILLLQAKNIAHFSYKEKAKHIAVVSQSVAVDSVRVEDFVLMGRMPYHSRFSFFEQKEDYEIAHRYMKLTGTYHLKDKLMTQLSGGEQQLVDIARALSQEPDLLLLDEATSHLDIGHQVQILNLLQKLNNDLKISILMIIHDLNLAGEYCDFLVMMNKGSIHIKGKPEEVLHYRHIEKVYNTLVVTDTNPISGKPIVLLVSENVHSRGQFSKTV